MKSCSDFEPSRSDTGYSDAFRRGQDRARDIARWCICAGRVYRGHMVGGGFLCDTGVIIQKPGTLFETEKLAQLDLLQRIAKVQLECLQRDLGHYAETIAKIEELQK